MKNIITIFITLFTVSTLSSQDIKSSTSGISVYVAPVYSTWESESFFLSDLAELEPSGYGVNLEVAYGINQNFTGVLGFTSLNHNINEGWDKFSFTSLNVLFRYNFGATLSAFRPFLEAGVTSLSHKVDPVSIDNYGLFELRNSGVGFVGGGGLDYFLKSNLSIGLKAQFMSGNFSSNELDGVDLGIDENVDYFFFNINIGVKYYFD